MKLPKPKQPPQRFEHHLHRKINGQYRAWSTGANTIYVLEDHEVESRTLGKILSKTPSIRVDCALAVGGQEHPVSALLDTGGTWSLMSAEFAEDIGLDPTQGTLLPKPINHGGRTLKGKVQMVDLILKAGKNDLAHDWGQDLRMDARFLITPDWTAPRVLLGVTGCLELLRVGVEVSPNQSDLPRWYFGAVA